MRMDHTYTTGSHKRPLNTLKKLQNLFHCIPTCWQRSEISANIVFSVDKQLETSPIPAHRPTLYQGSFSPLPTSVRGLEYILVLVNLAAKHTEAVLFCKAISHNITNKVVFFFSVMLAP